MRNLKKRLILLLAASFTLILIQCTSKFKEEVPFFDGLILEYDIGGGYKLSYAVHSFDDNKFRVIETETGSLGNVIEMSLDRFGRVYDSKKERYKDKYSPIWLPVHKMKVGDTFDKRSEVARKDKWEKWDVLVIKDVPTDAEDYFDLNTGYWVGSFAKTPGGTGKIVLVKTNANIPGMDKEPSGEEKKPDGKN